MIGELVGTFAAPLSGLLAITSGATVSGPGPVVKFVVFATAALASASVTPLIAMVICVLAGNCICGAIVTMVPVESNDMLDGTSVCPPPVILMVEPVTEIGFTTLLKVTTTRALTPTPVVAFGGPTETTAGAVGSLAGARGRLRRRGVAPPAPVLLCDFRGRA